MSTLKTSNLQNEASATVNVALDTSGGVAFPQLSGLLVANGSSAVTAPTKLTWSETYTQLSVGGSSWVSAMMSVGGTTPTTSNFSEAFVVAPTLHAACTSGNSIEAWLYTAASTALSSHTYYFARQGSLGAGTTITNQYGFYAHSNLTSATNNYGFHSNLASGTGRWNFYAAGNAPNYFAGTTTLAVAPIFSSLTGLVKANGASAATAAAAGTDYVAPGGALGTPSSGTLTNCTGYPRQTGDRDLLTTLTASNSAALQDAAILSTAGYVAFEIEFINLVPVTTGVNLHMRVYSGGAYQSTTYASSGIIPSNYFVYGQSGGGAPSGAYVAQGLLTWINTSVSNNSTMGGLCGRIKVDNPSGTSQYKTFYGHTDCSSHSWVGARMPTLVGFSWNGGAGAVAGFQVYFSSGNISTGSIKVWGLK